MNSRTINPKDRISLQARVRVISQRESKKMNPNGRSISEMVSERRARLPLVLSNLQSALAKAGAK